MADAKEILAKLRDPGPDGTSARLASILVEDAFGRTLGELLDVRFTAAAIREALQAFVASDAAAARAVAAAEEAERTLAAEKHPIDALLPAALTAGLRDLASLPVTPAREVVEKLLDREPLKMLLRGQVIDTLVAFGRKAASPVADNRIARGIGGLSKLAMGQAGKPNAFGAIANAVSGEVERQVEKRAADFADTAVGGILDGIAAQFADPSRAKEQVAVRLALLDGFLELSGAEVAQLARGPVAERVAVVRKTLAAWTAEPSFEADVEALVTTLLAKDASRSLRDVLADLGLREVVGEQAKDLVRRRIGVFVATDAFAGWLAELVG